MGLLLPSLFDIFAKVLDNALGMGGVKLPPGFDTAEKDECWEPGVLLDTLEINESCYLTRPNSKLFIYVFKNI